MWENYSQAEVGDSFFWICFATITATIAIAAVFSIEVMIFPFQGIVKKESNIRICEYANILMNVEHIDVF